MTPARAAPALAAAVLAGCAGAPRLADVVPSAAAVELRAVPFFPQREYQCGPAALATVLLASGVVVTADELTPQVFIPGREGSLQLEMLAAARRHGRVPYPLGSDIRILLAEVAAGRPVLVLQNLGFDVVPVWHYAVLVGFDGERGEVVLRSGVTERRIMRFGRFLATWQRAGNWAVVVTDPHEPPGSATAREWLASAAAFETLGQPVLAERAYRAATRRWPDEPLGWLALGNARHAQRDLAGAAQALRQAVAVAPSAAAHNNLAQVLLELGCPRQAQQQIERALNLDPAATAARQTAQAIASYAGKAAECNF